MIRISKNKVVIIVILLTFILCSVISACTPKQELPTHTDKSATNTPAVNPTSTTPPLPTETSQLITSINGFRYNFKHSPQIVDNTLWLPAQELFELLDRQAINRTNEFISTAGYNQDKKVTNCHYPIGGKIYSPDTENNIWIETKPISFIQDGEVFLSQKMIEDCVGVFINFNLDKKTADLSLENKQINTLQLDNTNPISFLELQSPDELSDSKIGALVSATIKNPASDWIEWSRSLKNDGFTRARITLNASDGINIDNKLVNVEKEIPTDYIEIYKELKKLGIKTRYSLNFWDIENRLNGGGISKERLNNEGEIQRYVTYVRMVTSTLKGLVSEYELWNEPDANIDYFQRIEPDVYIDIAKRVIPIIREVDPEAKIVVGSTSNYLDKPVQEYSRKILESDILPLADVISLHTVNNDASPVFHSDYYYGYDEMWKSIKSIAESHGFIGEYAADELNYRSSYSLSVLQPEIGDYHPYEPEIAAKYIGRMIAINLGLDISVGTSGTNAVERPAEGGMIRNMSYLMDGLVAAPQKVIVTSPSELIRYYTFKDQTGNQYIVLWNDAEALVKSDDTEASLILNDISATSVVATDPYLMNLQPLNFKNTEKGVELNQLLLKDYPILIEIETK